MNKLTGRTRFRAAEAVQLGFVPTPVLVWQVETVDHQLSTSGQSVFPAYVWRDGQVEDLCEINHIVYSTINVRVELPVREELPGEDYANPRKLH